MSSLSGWNQSHRQNFRGIKFKISKEIFEKSPNNWKLSNTVFGLLICYF
jgi:hypothetical protein